MRSNVNDDWFGTRSFYSDPDHERHGFALRIIAMSEGFDSERSRYRNEHWNRFMDKANNVFAYVLYTRKGKADATDEEIKGLSAARMKGLIKRACTQS